MWEHSRAKPRASENAGPAPYPVVAGAEPVVIGDYERSFVDSSSDYVNGSALVWNTEISALPEAGAGEASAEGTVNLALRYQPELISDANYNRIADPNDKPGLLYIKVTAYPRATAIDGNSNQSYNVMDKAHISASIVPANDPSAVERTFAEQVNGRTKSIRGPQTFYLKFDPSGQTGEAGPYGSTLYLVPIASFKTKATLDRDRQTFRSSSNVTEWNVGQLSAGMQLSAEVTPYFLSISSDLEGSYRKVTDASQLPTVIRYLNGTNVRVIDDTKIRGGTLDGNGPWAVVNDKGNADIVATWNPYQFYDAGWVGGVSFHANAPGFNSPTYFWSNVTGSVDPYGAVAYDKASLELPLIYSSGSAGPSIVRGIKLGGDKDGTGMSKLTFANVSVSDTNTTLNESYNVNWHLPYEKFNHLRTVAAAPKVYSPDQIDETEIAYQNGSFTTSVFYVGREVLLADYLDDIEQGFSLVSAASFENPATSVLLTGMGIAVSQIDPSSETVTAVPNNQDAWNEAVLLANTPAGKDWDDCKMTKPLISVHLNKHFYEYDAYDSKGYAGRKTKIKMIRRETKPVVYTGIYEPLDNTPVD